MKRDMLGISTSQISQKGGLRNETDRKDWIIIVGHIDRRKLVLFDRGQRRRPGYRPVPSVRAQ